MENGFPIMIIITNKECEHCTMMRGTTGWPKDTNKYFDSHKNKWNNEYFISLLKAGFTYQNSRVIEVMYDKLTSNPKVIEVTFFDLNDNDLMIKKYVRSDKDKVVLNTINNKTKFITKTDLGKNFDTFISKYVPLNSLNNYLHVFPLVIFFHNEIFENSIKNNDPLYGRVKGYNTIRIDDNMFGIQKSLYVDYSEINRNNVDIIRKLILNENKPLYYPID